MPRLPQPCLSLASLERRIRAMVLHWLATVAVIDEARETARLGERELACLDEAIEQAREAGR